jgi:hypothetical protein
MIDPDEEYAAYVDNRSDPAKTSVRYDEIIHLRMFLLDICDQLDVLEDPRSQSVRRQILEKAKTWGKDQIV